MDGRPPLKARTENKVVDSLGQRKQQQENRTHRTIQYLGNDKLAVEFDGRQVC